MEKPVRVSFSFMLSPQNFHDVATAVELQFGIQKKAPQPNP